MVNNEITQARCTGEENKIYKEAENTENRFSKNDMNNDSENRKDTMNLAENGNGITCNRTHDDNQEKSEENSNKRTLRESELATDCSNDIEPPVKKPLVVEKKQLTIREEACLKLGFELPTRPFTRADQQGPPWTDYSRKIFREKTRIHDINVASSYMRWWFDEHQSMPEPVEKPPRDAWRTYFLTRQKELHFSMKDSKTVKKISAEWKAMSDEESAPYHKQFEELSAKYEEACEKYEENLDTWRVNKSKLQERDDGQPRCQCEICVGEPVSL